MEEGLTIRYNEKTGLWEKHEPFITIDVMTEEEFNLIKAAVEHYQNRGRWEFDGMGWVCSECEEYPDKHADPVKPEFIFCPNCGVRMERE